MTRISSDMINVGVLTTLFMCVAFIANYTRYAPWWRHLPGKAMVSIDVALVITLMPNFLHLVFRAPLNNAFFIWYRVASLGITAATIAWRTWTIGHVNEQVSNPQAPIGDPPVEINSHSEEADDAVRPE